MKEAGELAYRFLFSLSVERPPPARIALPRPRRNPALREPATPTFPVWAKTKTEYGRARPLKEQHLSS